MTTTTTKTHEQTPQNSECTELYCTTICRSSENAPENNLKIQTQVEKICKIWEKLNEKYAFMASTCCPGPITYWHMGLTEKRMSDTGQVKAQSNGIKLSGFPTHLTFTLHFEHSGM